MYMRQFIGLALAFILLPVMLKVYPKVFKGKKAPLGPILMITALIIGTIGGLPALTMADSFKPAIYACVGSISLFL